MRRRAAFRREKSHNAGMLGVLGVLLMVFVTVGVSSVSLINKNNSLEERRVALVEEIEKQQAYTQELEQLKKYTKTKKYAEEVAKQKLGLVYSDEIVFKPEE